MNKPMTFEQARRKLARIAKGSYYSLQYDLSVGSKKHGAEKHAECTVYVADIGMFYSDTWAGAFTLLEAGGNRRKKLPPDPMEAPL